MAITVGRSSFMEKVFDLKRLEEIPVINEKDEAEFEDFFYKLWEDDRL